MEQLCRNARYIWRQFYEVSNLLFTLDKINPILIGIFFIRFYVLLISLYFSIMKDLIRIKNIPLFQKCFYTSRNISFRSTLEYLRAHV